MSQQKEACMSQQNEVCSDQSSSSIQDNIQDRFSEFEELNHADILTPNDILDNIKIYDSTM